MAMAVLVLRSLESTRGSLSTWTGWKWLLLHDCCPNFSRFNCVQDLSACGAVSGVLLNDSAAIATLIVWVARMRWDAPTTFYQIWWVAFDRILAPQLRVTIIQ